MAEKKSSGWWWLEKKIKKTVILQCRFYSVWIDGWMDVQTDGWKKGKKKDCPWNKFLFDTVWKFQKQTPAALVVLTAFKDSVFSIELFFTWQKKHNLRIRFLWSSLVPASIRPGEVSHSPADRKEEAFKHQTNCIFKVTRLISGFIWAAVLLQTLSTPVAVCVCVCMVIRVVMPH